MANRFAAEAFEVRASPRQTHVTEINVVNDVNTFAPFQCGLVAGCAQALFFTYACCAGGHVAYASMARP